MSVAIEPTSPRVPRSKPIGKPLSRAMRANKDRVFVAICVTAAAASVLVLLILLVSIFYSGWSHLTWQFLTGSPSRIASQAGILPAMAGTIAICLVCFVTAVPIGISTAILLEEFKPTHGLLRKLHTLVQLNITNLAGVPSIVYGILGLTVFVQMFNLMGNQQSPAFEVGAKYFDRFVTLDGKSALVPVASADAPKVAAAAAKSFIDDDGKPIAVTIGKPEEIGARARAAEDRLDVFESELEDRIDEIRTLKEPAALMVVLGEEWEKAGVGVKADALTPAFVQRIADAIAKPGREGKKALRTEVKSLAAELSGKAFPNTLLADAEPSRIQQPRPWYLRVPFGRSVLAGGLTLMLVVLPIIIISTQEALRSVSDSLRRASLALGATKWQTIWNVTLPSALPGVMTGVILAMSRAIGEAAPVLIIAGIVYITFVPRHLMDDFTAMPLQIYQWAGLPQSEFHSVAAAGILLLLAILLCFNGLAIYIRQHAQKQL
jgi:phosphate transport system permease protein